MYRIVEVKGPDNADAIHLFNTMRPDLFKPLRDYHIRNGYWWFVFYGDDAIGFAGLISFEPFPDKGYMLRSLVMEQHRGHGLHRKLIRIREIKCRDLDFTQVVSECRADNTYSADNFARAGYRPCQPLRPWAQPDDGPTIYWVKDL
jgi:hypothetical protein